VDKLWKERHLPKPVETGEKRAGFDVEKKSSISKGFSLFPQKFSLRLLLLKNI